MVPDAGQDPDPKLSPNAKSAEGDRGSGPVEIATAPAETEANDTDARGNVPKTAKTSLKAALARLPFDRPVAEDLTPEEILAFLERGDDPWAAGSGAEGPIEIVPIRDLLAACGLAQAFGEAADLDALTAPGRDHA